LSLVLDTGTMKYRENPNQPWRPLVIKAGMNWESMADTYDPDNGTYEVGQYVLEEGMMYRCISEITTPEAWTPAHWTSVNVGDELSSFIIISDDQPTDETNKIWIAETTAPFGVQVPTMDDHIALENTLNQLDDEIDTITTPTTATGIIPTGSYYSDMSVYQINGVKCLTLTIYSTDTPLPDSGYIKIATLPSGYGAAFNTVTQTFLNSSKNVFLMNVTTAGDVNIYNVSGASIAGAYTFVYI